MMKKNNTILMIAIASLFFMLLNSCDALQIVSGTVYDNTTKQAIDSAFVKKKGSETSTYTNRNGYFKIEDVGLSPTTVVISKAGYDTVIVEIENGKSKNIYLEKKSDKYIKSANLEDEKVDNKLPGSRITIDEAIEKSMIIPVSDSDEIQYTKPIIAKCIAIEKPIEPGQVIVEACYYYHKFEVTEILLGIIDNEFECDYITYIPNNEQNIEKDKAYILILQESKAVGKYHLIKALNDTEKSRKEIKTAINKLSYLKKKNN